MILQAFSKGCRSIGLLLPLLAACALASTAVAQEEGAEISEKYRAILISMGSVGPGRATQMDIGIERWTTDEERAALLEVVTQNDPKALAKALRKQEKVGWARLRGRLAYDLHYAREWVDGDQRVLILATDRPIGMAEARNMTRSMDYNISIMELRLDAEGNGDGTFAAGAEIEFDDETKTLSITSYSSEPVRLTKVKRLD